MFRKVVVIWFSFRREELSVSSLDSASGLCVLGAVRDAGRESGTRSISMEGPYALASRHASAYICCPSCYFMKENSF